MDWNQASTALFTALGLGLMIGVVRERAQPPHLLPAGTRTHALVALLGCTAWLLSPWVMVAVLLAVTALTVIAYRASVAEDPGLTGEIALLMTCLLGGLAAHQASLAAALAVVVAILLQAKAPLQKLSREWISEGEIQDILMLAAAALVVMPLLPEQPLDRWGVVSPMTVWKIVVLIMAVGMFGHFAQRLLGARWGLAIAGFFAGFASSTAAVTSMGQQARNHSALTIASAAAALLANLASLLLFVAVVAAASPALLQASAAAFAGAVGGLLLVIAGLLAKAHSNGGLQPQAGHGKAFKIQQALLIAGLIAGVSLLAAWLEELFGHSGALAAAIIVALAEVHAAAAGVAQLAATGKLPVQVASIGIIAVLAASCLSKGVIACIAGGRRYGLLVGSGLLAMLAGALIGLLLG